MPNDILSTQGLARWFGSLQAVNELDLKVPAGSIYGFLGPNGAGKTTTIRMLLGLIRPTQGEVFLFGQPVHAARRSAGRSACQSVLRRVGSLVETPSLYPHLTGRENLEVMRRLLGLTKVHVERVLYTVHLQADAHRLVKHYSLGMCQRLGLAMALLPEPQLLILDEPTNGLDPAGMHEMRLLLTRLAREQGITVFLSSHLLNEVEQIATQVGIIQKGGLIFQGSPDELRSQLGELLSLGVDQPEQAAHLLQRAGWTVQRQDPHHLLVEVNGDSDVALLNAQLVEKGLNVFHLNLQRPSLEDIFLSLTKAKGLAV